MHLKKSIFEKKKKINRNHRQEALFPSSGPLLDCIQARGKTHWKTKQKSSFFKENQNKPFAAQRWIKRKTKEAKQEDKEMEETKIK